jgi:hypothetical protein
MSRECTSLNEHVKELREAYDLAIRELRRQRARCKKVARQVAARHGEEEAKRMVVHWIDTIRAQTIY